MHNFMVKFNNIKSLEISEFPKGNNKGVKNLANDSVLKAAVKDFVESNLK
jgi:hypothetical protein